MIKREWKLIDHVACSFLMVVGLGYLAAIVTMFIIGRWQLAIGLFSVILALLAALSFARLMIGDNKRHW